MALSYANDFRISYMNTEALKRQAWKSKDLGRDSSSCKDDEREEHYGISIYLPFAAEESARRVFYG